MESRSRSAHTTRMEGHPLDNTMDGDLLRSFHLVVGSNGAVSEHAELNRQFADVKAFPLLEDTDSWSWRMFQVGVGMFGMFYQNDLIVPCV